MILVVNSGRFWWFPTDCVRTAAGRERSELFGAALSLLRGRW